MFGRMGSVDDQEGPTGLFVDWDGDVQRFLFLFVFVRFCIYKSYKNIILCIYIYVVENTIGHVVHYKYRICIFY